MNAMPILMFLWLVSVTVYPPHKSWGYVVGASLGVLFVLSWFMVTFNYI